MRTITCEEILIINEAKFKFLGLYENTDEELGLAPFLAFESLKNNKIFEVEIIPEELNEFGIKISEEDFETIKEELYKCYEVN